MSAVNTNAPPPPKPPKLCLVCSVVSPAVYRVCSSSGEEKNLKGLIERYGGVGVRADDVICRNCLSRLQTVHKLSTDLRSRCQTNAAREGGNIFMVNLPVPATLTAPQSTHPTAKTSASKVSAAAGKAPSTPVTKPTRPTPPPSTPTGPPRTTPTGPPRTTPPLVTKPTTRPGQTSTVTGPQTITTSRLTATLCEPPGTPLAMVSCTPRVTPIRVKTEPPDTYSPHPTTSHTHTPCTHTPSTHTPSAHTPKVHTPSTHTPSAHTPKVHTPSTHTPSAHTPSMHTSNVRTVMPSGHTPSGHTPNVRTVMPNTSTAMPNARPVGSHTPSVRPIGTLTCNTHTSSTPTPNARPLTAHTPSTHTPSTHTPSTHTATAPPVSAQTPSTHTLSTHKPSTHTPSTHTPSPHPASTYPTMPDIKVEPGMGDDTPLATLGYRLGPKKAAVMACFMCGNTSVAHLRIVNPYSSQGKMQQLIPALEETFDLKMDFEQFPRLRGCIKCYNGTMKALRLKRSLVAHMNRTQYQPPPRRRYDTYTTSSGQGSFLASDPPPHFRQDDHTYCQGEEPGAQADRLIKRGGIFRRRRGRMDADQGLVDAYKGNKEAREKIEQMILMDLKTSCDRLCSLYTPPGPSVLRNSCLEELKKRDLVSDIIIEMEKAMPLVLDIFKTICSPVHALASNTKRTVATLYAMAMYCRNPHLGALQVLHSLAVDRYTSKNHLLDVFQKCSFTLFSSRIKGVLRKAEEKPATGDAGNQDGQPEAMETDYVIDCVLESQNFPKPKRFVPLTMKREIKKEKSVSAETASTSGEFPSTSGEGLLPLGEFSGSEIADLADCTGVTPLHHALGTPALGTPAPRPVPKPRSKVKKEPRLMAPKKKTPSKPKTENAGQKRKSTNNGAKTPVKRPKKPKSETSTPKRPPKSPKSPKSPAVRMPTKTVVISPPVSGLTGLYSGPSDVSPEVAAAVSALYGEMVELDLNWVTDDNFVHLPHSEVVCLEGDA